MGASKYILYGPFEQLVTMQGLPMKGAISDEELPCLRAGGVLVKDGRIHSVGEFSALKASNKAQDTEYCTIPEGSVALPGFIDAHTHICFAGSRARDYAARNAGKSYLEIAQAGGGIWDTVQKTRAASKEELVQNTISRAKAHLITGTTTLEVKSGYGLKPEEEIKMLEAIAAANAQTHTDLIPTCLAAHTLPKDREIKEEEYLREILTKLLPVVKEKQLAKRVDIFVEDGAFSETMALEFLQEAMQLGFKATVHADQFTTGGSRVAVEAGALSADHLEVSGDSEIQLLANSEVMAIALPGASLGLGCGFTPARKLLDAGAGLAIASDHNPGSAPMGQLVTQAAILGTFEKLTQAEVFAGITYRAAHALDLKDRGVLAPGMLADLCVYEVSDICEILYHQGNLKPSFVIKKGEIVYDQSKGIS